jgi:hypothetical protein
MGFNSAFKGLKEFAQIRNHIRRNATFRMNTQALQGKNNGEIFILPGVAEAQLNSVYFYNIIVFIILQFIVSKFAL